MLCKAQVDLKNCDHFLFFIGVNHQCDNSAGAPLVTRLCGATKILSTKLDATVTSDSVCGKSRKNYLRGCKFSV